MMSQQSQSELAQPGDMLVLGKREMRPVLARLNPVDVAMHAGRINTDRDDGENVPSYSSESEDDSCVADPDYHPTPDDDQRRPSAGLWARDLCGAAAPQGGKGRVKVKIELVKNKTKRYKTFSKRKNGIMKKAHELAMLTGNQVLLVVVSETGHMYTNATRKLQPMLTGEDGKALIRTCLNSPDPPSHYDLSRDERMSSRGYEEADKIFQVSSERPAEGRRTEAATPTHIGGAPQTTELVAPSTTTMQLDLGSGGLSSFPITIPPSGFSYVPTGTAPVMYNSPHTVLYPSNVMGADVGCMHNGQWIPMVSQCSS